jgi:collagenase-like PrtC family protease
MILTYIRKGLVAAQTMWTESTPETMSTQSEDNTLSHETRRRHALENRDKNLRVVQELEGKMGIVHRWKIGGSDWQAAAKLVVMRQYRRALDNLESLVVARIFELSKMNMSGTGELFFSLFLH